MIAAVVCQVAHASCQPFPKSLLCNYVINLVCTYKLVWKRHLLEHEKQIFTGRPETPGTSGSAKSRAMAQAVFAKPDQETAADAKCAH